MWLLDANMDVHVASLLGGFGFPCEAATQRGWQALDNGHLVSAAVEAGFTCLLTQDRLFAESASRALKTSPAWKSFKLAVRLGSHGRGVRVFTGPSI